MFACVVYVACIDSCGWLVLKCLFVSFCLLVRLWSLCVFLFRVLVCWLVGRLVELQICLFVVRLCCLIELQCIKSFLVLFAVRLIGLSLVWPSGCLVVRLSFFVCCVVYMFAFGCCLIMCSFSVSFLGWLVDKLNYLCVESLVCELVCLIVCLCTS